MSLCPFFKSPFSDLTNNIATHQWYGRCAELEMKAIDCIDAYGLDRARSKCGTLLDDFHECNRRHKQFKRAVAMRAERHRQYLTGERSKKDLYADPPVIDSY